MFVNHRPVFGLDPSRIKQSFEVLGKRKDDTLVLDRGHLLGLLQSKGIETLRLHSLMVLHWLWFL